MPNESCYGGLREYLQIDIAHSVTPAFGEIQVGTGSGKARFQTQVLRVAIGYRVDRYALRCKLDVHPCQAVQRGVDDGIGADARIASSACTKSAL